MRWYQPLDQLSETHRERGLRYLFQDGLAAHAMTLLVTGAFLPGMALALGASNFVIGLLASLGPVSQMLQIPAILLVEKAGLRKLLTVVFALLSRIALLCVAALPFLDLGGLAVPLFLFLMLVFFGAGSIAGCSWNSWIKDLIPQTIMGSYLARRMSAATLLGAILTVSAGFGIDFLIAFVGGEATAYGTIFGVAALIGLVGVWILSRVPEPRMAPRETDSSWWRTLLEPMKDANFRRLLAFTGAWNFAIIMAGAFFAVYMLRRIGISMGGVILLAVLSQVTNVYFFKVWGNIADRFSNKSVLQVTAPLFIVVILLYPFTTLPNPHFLTIPLLVLIHFLGGVSTAGFTLCAQNIALRFAPEGKATAYLGANAFCGGLAATVAPILGGIIGSFFAAREISLQLVYRQNIASEEAVMVPAINFQGIDFVFFTAAMVGFYALHRLSLVEEEGTIDESAVRDEVRSSVRRTFASVSNIAGVRRITYFPYELLMTSTRQTTKVVRKARNSIRTNGNGKANGGEPPPRKDAPDWGSE